MPRNGLNRKLAIKSTRTLAIRSVARYVQQMPRNALYSFAPPKTADPRQARHVFVKQEEASRDKSIHRSSMKDGSQRLRSERKRKVEWAKDHQTLKLRRVEPARKHENVDLASLRMALRAASTQAKLLLTHAQVREKEAAQEQILLTHAQVLEKEAAQEQILETLSALRVRIATQLRQDTQALPGSVLVENIEAQYQ